MLKAAAGYSNDRAYRNRYSIDRIKGFFLSIPKPAAVVNGKVSSNRSVFVCLTAHGKGDIIDLPGGWNLYD
jgi:hypothetical protein